MKNEKLSSEGLIQFIKFGIVGVSNTAVDWVVFFMITQLIIADKSFEPTAKVISFLAAMLNSYIWNTIWTFKKQYEVSIKGGDTANAKMKIFVKFAIVSIAGWLINYFAFKYTRFNLNQGQIVSLIVASGAATFLNFFMNKLWTYKK